MAFYDWFNAQRPVIRPATLQPRRDLAALAAPAQSREGVFVTPQSLTSFAGASLVVTAVTQVIYRLIPTSEGNLWVPFVCALLVGATVFIISELDPLKAPKSRREWFIGVVIAFINSIVLFNAAIGAGALVTPA